MKKAIVVIFLLSSMLNYGQNHSILKNQKIIFNEAETCLKKNESEKAAVLFRQANDIDRKSKTGEAAIRKYDSITQNTIVKNILGKWILSESGSNWGFTEEKDLLKRKILLITENEFQFYEENIQSKELKSIKTEKMIFTKKEDMSGSRFDFVFSDKSLWRIVFDKEHNFLRQLNTGEETNEGRTEIFCGNTDLRYKKYN